MHGRKPVRITGAGLYGRAANQAAPAKANQLCPHARAIRGFVCRLLGGQGALRHSKQLVARASINDESRMDRDCAVPALALTGRFQTAGYSAVRLAIAAGDGDMTTDELKAQLERARSILNDLQDWVR